MCTAFQKKLKTPFPILIPIVIGAIAGTLGSVAGLTLQGLQFEQGQEQADELSEINALNKKLAQKQLKAFDDNEREQKRTRTEVAQRVGMKPVNIPMKQLGVTTRSMAQNMVTQNAASRMTAQVNRMATTSFNRPISPLYRVNSVGDLSRTNSLLNSPRATDTPPFLRPSPGGIVNPSFTSPTSSTSTLRAIQSRTGSAASIGSGPHYDLSQGPSIRS